MGTALCLGGYFHNILNQIILTAHALFNHYASKIITRAQTFK